MLLAALRDGEDRGRARRPARARPSPSNACPARTSRACRCSSRPRGRWRGRPRPYLLLAAEHDGPAEPWLAAVARELDAVLAHCAFWPGAADPAEVARWARERTVDVGFSVVATDATVEQIGAALRRQAAVRQLIAMGERP